MQRGDRQVTRAAAFGAATLAGAAAVIVGAAGLVTAHYDPLTRTISRLAVPGMPAALAVDAAIAAMGFACLALAWAARRTRVPLSIAGLGFLFAAVIHLDPASVMSTAGHRIASGVAVGALAAAAITAGAAYGRLSLALGVAAVAMLAVAAALLMTPFAAWGAWERVLLALQLCWIVTTALKIASAEASTTAPAAMASSAGS